MLKKILFIIHIVILLLFAFILPSNSVFAKGVVIDDETEETQKKGNLKSINDNTILYLNQINEYEEIVYEEQDLYWTWFYNEYDHEYLIYFNTDCFQLWQIMNDSSSNGWAVSSNAFQLRSVNRDTSYPRYYVKLTNLQYRWVQIRSYPNTTQTNGTRFHVNVIDLTEMYGEGNEPTLEECRNIFTIDYLPYAPLSDKLLILSTYTTAYQVGYLTGFDEGYDQGILQDITSTTWVENVFNALSAFLNIEILPNATIGLIVGIPFIISLAWFVIKSFRGGGE